MIIDVIDIEDKIGYSFKNKALLKQAFTHSSFANEKKLQSNENLEFLGDSILNFTVAEYLYRKYPDKNEGELSRLRAANVSAQPLCAAIEKLQLGAHMYLGVGEAKSEDNRENIYADLFEAIVAGIFLDSNLENAKAFVLSALKDGLERESGIKAEIDYKTKLQEVSQKSKGSKLRYDLLEKSGPDHNPEYLFAAVLNDETIGTGKGRSKREAQQFAAQAGLRYLKIIEE